MYYVYILKSLKVQDKDFASKSAYKRWLSNRLSHPKRHLQNFPAIKIGRLAVNQSAKGAGIGRMILNYIIAYAIEQNKQCACRFIIVDAYDQSLLFYEKIGFSYLSDNDKGQDTRQMNLDITQYILP